MASAASSPPNSASIAKPAPAQSTMSIAAGGVDVPAAQVSSRCHPISRPSQISFPMEGNPAYPATAAHPQMTPVLAPPSPTLSNDAERYVRFVFTHKDRDAAPRAYAELQDVWQRPLCALS
jgi:hypothetical protein